MMDLEHDQVFDEVTAEEGEELLIQGFTGHDLVLGVLRPADAGTDEQGEAVFPLYGLSVRSEITSVAIRNIPGQASEEGGSDVSNAPEGETAARLEEIALEEVLFYQPEGGLIRAAETDDTHVTVYVLRGQDGIYTDAGKETLLRTAGDDAGEADVRLLRETGEIRETVWYLPLSAASGDSGARGTFSGTLGAARSATLVTAGEPELAESGMVKLSGNEGPERTWFAYARGHLVGAFGSLNEAVAAAYPDMGLVLDESGERVWSRLSANAEAAAAAAAAADAPEEETAEMDGTTVTAADLYKNITRDIMTRSYTP